MVGETISHYRITREIGGGGMGVVYEAVDTLLQVPVAIKLIRDSEGDRARERFLREAKAIAGLDHPNICGFREIDTTPDGQLFLVMAYCGGGSLARRIEGRRLSPFETFEVAGAVLRGLTAAHDAGIIHRDIKPANLVYSDRYLKIVDFGLALLEDHTRMSARDRRPGTLAYMSPEQLRGRDLDARTDLWSLGIVLYRAAAGQHPFEAENSEAIAYRATREPHEPLTRWVSSVPEPFSRFIDRCLEKDPDDRFQSAREAQAALASLGRQLDWGDPEQATVSTTSAHTAVTDPGSTSSSAAPPAAGSGIGRVFGVGLLLLLLAGLGYWLLRPTGPYVTPERFAVLPFENRVGDAAERAFVLGLSDVASEALAELVRAEESAWLIPFPYVLTSGITSASRAPRAFGVNRIVTGELQRFDDGLRLSLRTLNERGRLVGSATIDFDPDQRQSLLQDLPAALAEAGRLPAPTRETGVPARAAEYLLGRGLTQRPTPGANPEQTLAESSLRAVLEEDPAFLPARAWLAMNLWFRWIATRDSTTRADALSLVADADTTADASLDALRLVGTVRYRFGDAAGAIEPLRRVLAGDPGAIEAARDLARAYTREKRFDEAEAVLEHAAAVPPDRYLGSNIAGTHFVNTGDFDRGIAHLLNAVEFAPDDGKSLNALGAAYDRKVEPERDRAREYWVRAFGVWPSCDTANNIGLSHYRDAEFVQSAHYFELALAYCDSTDHEAWGNLGRARYWVDGERDAALENVRRAREIAEEDLKAVPGASLLGHLAGYSSMLGDADATSYYVAKVDSIDSLSPLLRFQLAVAKETIGDRSDALLRLNDALQRDLPIEHIEASPWLASLREDPSYQALAEANR